MKAPKIMVIDDENIVGKMLKVSFERDGFQVETFNQPQDALNRLAEEKFDVVITDLKMKDIDGMEILKQIKKDSPETKVVIITAYASLDASIEAFKEKADDFFPKPIKIADLKDRVKKLLDE